MVRRTGACPNSVLFKVPQVGPVGSGYCRAAARSGVLRSLGGYPDMSLEIERKFLVANEGWKTAEVSGFVMG